MSSISDAAIVGITLFLLLGAVGYYLYSRMNQLERKVSLMENILLDLKVTTEQTLMSATEMTDTRIDIPTHGSFSNQQPPSPPREVFQANEPTSVESVEFIPASSSLTDIKEVSLETQTPRKSPVPTVQVEREVSTSNSSVVHVNYEAMTYKELAILARQNSIAGVRNMTKAQLIDALKGKTVKTDDMFQPLESTATKNTEERILSLNEVTDSFGSSLQEAEIESSFVESS